MTAEGFWLSTPGEIADALLSYHRRRKAALTERAAMDYRLASLIGLAFCGKVPPLHEAYPGLFDAPDVVQDWRVAKDRLMRYAEAHNRAREEAKKVDGGRIASSNHCENGPV